jgi:CRISPR-associated protein Cmr3
VWFYRTNRPFGAVQAASSDGTPYLLPPAGVMFGAIRTKLGEGLGVNWEEYGAAWANGATPATGPHRLIGSPDSERHTDDAVHLLGCLPAMGPRENPQALFPLPAFVLVGGNRQSHEEYGLRHLHPASPRRFPGQSSLDELLPVMVADPDFMGQTKDLFINQAVLRMLLLGETTATNPCIVERERIAEEEPHVGIARDISRRTTRQGYLYAKTTYRWRSRAAFGKDSRIFGLQVLIDNVKQDQLGTKRFVQLGGERRLGWASEQVVDGWLDAGLKTEISTAVRAKKGWWLYLATAAWFKHGWHPNVDSQHGKLVAFQAGQPVLRGGWDLQRNRPRPLRQQMPEGTTWFFTLPEGAGGEVVDEVMKKYHGKCIADEWKQAGEGLAFVGAWDVQEMSK